MATLEFNAVYIETLGNTADPKLVVDLARLAAVHGWDGVFLYDHIFLGASRTIDPWVTLGAVAGSVPSLALGPMVTPLARRHPAKLAHEISTLANLADGAVIVGVGLGVWNDYEAVGDLSPRVPSQRRRLGRRLDEHLDELELLLGRSPARGPHPGDGPLVIANAERVRLWGAGSYRRAQSAPPPRRVLERARRLDGFFPVGMDWEPDMPISVDEFAASIAALKKVETDPLPKHFALVACGHSSAPADVEAYAAVGANVWLEFIDGDDPSSAQARIESGPH